MKTYVSKVIELIEKGSGVHLTEEQAIGLINDSGFKDEIVEFNGETIWDTSPRETLISVLCEKITGRQSWHNSEIINDPEGYQKWLESFSQMALKRGYRIVND